MTQLSLFDPPATVLDLSAASVPESSPVGPGAPATEPSETSNTRIGRQRGVNNRPAATTLCRLAELIHEGRSNGKTARCGGVQRIGDLAQLVLVRHDLVARRKAVRAERNQRTDDRTGTAAKPWMSVSTAS